MYKFLLLVLLFVQLDCVIYRDRPKIKSTDGNIVIQPAYGKNIYLQPNGPQSNIYVEDINLIRLSLSNITAADASASNYHSVTTAPNDVFLRLERLENLVTALQKNLTRVLSRRLNRLASRVSTLQALLNSPNDECQSQQCQHGGTCLNLINGYHCLCPLNWEGKNCETDVNECRNFAGTDLGCQNGATCINRPGSYECLCRPGWFGLHCTRKAKDCQQGDYEMCGHGTCIKTETGKGIKCICDQGWTTNGSDVVCLTDVNECDSSQGPRCSVNPKVDCVNLPGSFRCGRCPAGFDGDGFVCYDIDECLTIPNGGCSVSPMVSCHNTIGSRVCGSCPLGFEGNGVTCTWRGTCNINRGGCHSSARCIDSPSAGLLSIPQCLCPAGMAGDGVGIHGCYVPNANNVSQLCEGNPCGPNGHCHLLRQGYTCICDEGYMGIHCENNDNICSSNPCLNGGTCRRDVSSETGFRCECTALYSGVVCQVNSKLCGGVLDAQEGSIIYPTSNTTYNHNARCAWVIHTSPSYVIDVIFSKFNLEDSSDCSYDFLQIHDGRSSASQIIGRFCGNTYPKGGHFQSSDNNLYFWFRSDRTVAKEGFALHWTSVKPSCGGPINATTHGHVSSPGWPGKYPPNRDCHWHLTTSLGKRIQLHFFAFDIESSANCSFDYVAIYDGDHTTDPLLSKLCNSSQPAPLLSAGSEVLVHFHSNEHGNGNGFQIAFAPADGVPGCGGYYTADKGEIVSPSYNNKYLNNLNCEFKIKTSPDTKIRIDFRLFQLERSFRCNFDYLKIYDGPTPDSRLVGKYCDSSYPKYYISSSNTLLIQFKTDRSLSSNGFKIAYKSICLFTILGDSGILKSPGYPFSYPNNKMCEYIITTRPGRSIVLTFQDFDIEDNRHFNCLYDYVEIRDGVDSNATLLGRFCGSGRIPPDQTSSLNYMYIIFKSDNSISGTGFYANYTTLDTRCGGIYRENTGVISHPASGDTYENSESCTWVIVAPEGMHIMVTWNRFEVEDMPDCFSDYVELIEIDVNMANSTLGKYCGTDNPSALTVSSNRLMVKFVSDSSIRSSGFSLSYTFIDQQTHCDGFYVKTHGYIFSPGWPQSYEPNRDCTWTITIPVGQQILLNITNFHLDIPIHDNCDLGDYLEIRNGATSSAPLVGKYCGYIPRQQITSTGNSIYLHFHSDSYFSGKGFQIEWDGTITGCGGTLTSNRGSISSPNYPEEYHDNAECFYRIVTSSGSRIRLTFSDLQLEVFSYCSDYIEIFDGRDFNAASLGKFCKMIPKLDNLETNSNYAFIKFHSDFSISAKGFLFNYETICNNTVTGAYGVIESPGFPSKYPTNANCLWTIEVPKGNKINVTFTHFDLTKTYSREFFPWGYYHSMRHRLSSAPLSALGTCDNDYLQTRENLAVSFNNKLCGSVLPSQIQTKSNMLQIHFVSGPNFLGTGFRLEWIKHGCGGHIQKRSGTLMSERNLFLSQEIECEWLIETPAGTGISLSIIEIRMEVSPNCSTDALEIYNGQSTASPLITKICGKESSVMTSTGNLMFIRFTKRSSSQNIYFISTFDSRFTVNCGGRVESRSGMIHSTNYPKNYDDHLDCIWYLQVPMNHRIELNIIELDLYSSNDYDGVDCGDHINIYDGRNLLNSNYSYQICPQSNISQIVTKSNHLTLQFVTDSQGTAKGFKANFTTICGATIEALYDGVIKNDDYISNSTKNCTWTILAPSLDQKIKLTINHMSIPQHIFTNNRCPSSFLKIFDGIDDSSPSIGEYCGKLVPPMLVSRGSAMTIQFGTHADMMDGRFSARYTSLETACGGTLTSEEGNIASPNYPLSYPLNIDCEWILSTSPGNRVYITFENFDLEYSDGCNEDYLEVRENNGGGQLLGVYCGNSVPTNTTAATKLYIKFRSDDKNSHQGFVARYGFLHGNDITGLEAGEIASPLYPNPYYGSGQYTWRILTSGSGRIRISLDRLEIHQQNNLCNSYLAIFDGYNEDAPLIEKLCEIITSNIQTKVIETTSTVAYVKLVLDDTYTEALFHLQWTTSEKNTDMAQFSERINCGSNGTQLIAPGNTTKFSSPGYPSNYEPGLNCEWVFMSEPSRHLILTFIEISIENTPGCYADYISIYSSTDLFEWLPIKEHICSADDIQNKTFTSSYLQVSFKTDSSMSHKGFQAKVNSLCGGRVTEQSGTVSPTWSDMKNHLERISRCDWTVKVRPGRSIKLKFDHFNITNNLNECTTYVILRNGDSTEAPVLAKYCGFKGENRNEIITSGNSVYITYVVDLYFQLRSFQNFVLHYEEKNIECGVTSKLDSVHKWEIISTPNYPSVPAPYTECIWKFTGPPGEILRIDFIDRFDLKSDKSCSQEVVEVRDGASENAPLKGRFCSTRPGTIKTNNNYMFIKYITQLTEPRDGFKANITIDACGGTIIANAGEVTSPYYPEFYLPIGTVCEWHIMSSPHHVIQLQFRDISLPESLSDSPCATKVEVIDPLPSNRTVLKTVCGDYEDNSEPIISSFNEVIIRLIMSNTGRSYQFTEYKGFRLTFNSSRKSCGGLITTPEGFLTTPGYPRETTMGYCQWVIEVPNKNRRVRLEITDIDIMTQKLAVYNDENFRTLIKRVPGNDIYNVTKVIQSSGNKIAFYLLTNAHGVAHRFKAMFSSNEEALCGGEVSGLSGFIESPHFDMPTICEWQYNNVYNTGDLNNTNGLQYNTMYINLSINSSTTSQTFCRFSDSVVSISSKSSRDEISFFRYICGNSTNVSYRIPLNSFHIKSIQNDNFPLGYFLLWKRQPCGGIVHITRETTNILNVPLNYSDPIDCAWVLLTSAGIRLEIKLEGLFMLDCLDEYIQISEGLSQYAAFIGDYCRDRTPQTPLSATFVQTYIQYHSKNPNITKIKIKARSVTDQCGGLMTTGNYIFVSPNYPHGYSNNLECTWEIQSELGSRISLQFLERFAIEDTVNCTKDALIIYDWKNNEYIEMTRVCGRHLPGAYNSTANKMKVTLRTDSAIYLDGFKAQWVEICGGQFFATDKQQYIYSPGYPYKYNSSLNCVYDIFGSDNINLQFEEFELEGTYPECRFDNLTIIGQGRGNYFYEVFCGKQSPKPSKSFNNIKLTFQTDSYVQRRGFKLSYSLYSCNGVVKEPTLITLGNLESYDNNMNCSWIIQAPINKVVVLKFLFVKLENYMECYNDYIAVFNGIEQDLSKRIALICGFFNSTKTIRSSGNKALLQFVSDSNLSFKGFKVEVLFSYSESVGCGGRINLTSTSSKILKSPLIGTNVVYENYLDCHWEVSAPIDYVIQVAFKSFHIAPCENVNQTALGFSNCVCDMLEFRDGINPNSFLIERYCGHTVPTPITSSRNLLSITLSTDGEINSSGFELLLTIQRSLCGRTTIHVSHSVQRWTSPGYETETIPRGLHCKYDLDTSQEPYSTVQVTIHDLDIEGYSNDKCVTDKLLITGDSKPHNASTGQNYILNADYDNFFNHAYFYGLTLQPPNRLELCGPLKSIDFYVQGRISINLLTSPENTAKKHRGVEIEVVYLDFCGRNYTGTQGRIQSSFNIRGEDGTQRDCYTLITAPENHTISMYFMSVNPDYINDKVFLKIYDGNNTNTNLLLKITDSFNDLPVFSNSRHLLLHNSAFGYNSITYDLNYIASDRGRGCGGRIDNIVGTVASPLYPEVFRRKTTCQWELTTPVGTRLMLHFRIFDLGMSCDQNYVELQDKNSNLLSRYCDETPANYFSKDNFVKIVFVTTLNNVGSGWVAEFTGFV